MTNRSPVMVLHPRLGIGLLTGRYGQEELESAGAYRVYEDPLNLLKHLEEAGIRSLLG